ncbi:MAG TPA: glycosyltransferase family 4 protein, partial [Candidatus Binataceae bacterium]|nr:glycosyltransferase family 4 protein [Candidatus Binataceae bacterium]
MTESPMRIALLCESFGALGGVAQIVEELAAEFALAGHRVAIVSNPAGGTLLARSVNQQIEQVLLDLPRAKPASWRHPERWFARSRANELLDFIRRWRPVLLNIHGGLRDRFPAVLEVCYEAEIPLVQSIHLVPETVAHYALTALHEARAITFPSDSVMNAFERLSPDAKRGQVIRGGANLELALKAPAYRR